MVVIAILAAIVTLGYNQIQERAATASVLSTLRQGHESLEANYVRHRDYPPNLAGTDFMSSDGVATVLYTNAPFARVHTGLTREQSAQLLLNVCNANMPIVDGSTTYNTSCSFAGQNFHVKGQQASNIVIHGPTVNQAGFQLRCGAACDQARQVIMSQFSAQGGTWPITIPIGQVSLPEPNVAANGKADRFCMEARYDRFPDMTVSHIRSGQSTPSDGPCPNDPTLRYMPDSNTRPDPTPDPIPPGTRPPVEIPGDPNPPGGPGLPPRDNV